MYCFSTSGETTRSWREAVAGWTTEFESWGYYGGYSLSLMVCAALAVCPSGKGGGRRASESRQRRTCGALLALSLMRREAHLRGSGESSHPAAPADAQPDAIICLPSCTSHIWACTFLLCSGRANQCPPSRPPSPGPPSSRSAAHRRLGACPGDGGC